MKATAPKTPVKKEAGLAASKYAEEAESEEADAEGEHDSSSAALASVRKPFS
jgi:hypothetical protein